jgi:hypothetical protein
MIEASMGHIALQGYGERLQEPCTLPAKFVDASAAFDSVRDLVARYRMPETKTLIFLAPIPTCQNAGQIVSRSYAELGSAPPQELPPHLFLDDSNFTHLSSEGVADATHALAEAARSELSSAEAGQQTSTVSNHPAASGYSVRR